MHKVERAYPIIYAGIVERTIVLNNYAGISGYDVINDMTSLAASLWALYRGGGWGGVTYTKEFLS
jgi:hypothetical protein